MMFNFYAVVHGHICRGSKGGGMQTRFVGKFEERKAKERKQGKNEKKGGNSVKFVDKKNSDKN